MASFIQNILWNSVEGFVEAGTRSAGEYAGNALIKVGDAIENGGRGVGNCKFNDSSLSTHVLTILSHREESHWLRLYHLRTNLQTGPQRPPVHSAQANGQAIEFSSCLQQTWQQTT